MISLYVFFDGSSYNAISFCTAFLSPMSGKITISDQLCPGERKYSHSDILSFKFKPQLIGPLW